MNLFFLTVQGTGDYKPVIALLNHKLIKDACPGEIDKITDYINKKNIVYVAGKYLRFNALTQAIFSTEASKTIDYILSVLQLLSSDSRRNGNKFNVFPVVFEIVEIFLS
mgnify:CR=1 FL=1